MNNDIRAAFSETVSERYESLCENPVNHRFSFAYGIKRRALIKRYNAGRVQPVRYMPVRRIKFVVLAVILAVAVLMGASLWNGVDGFGFQKYPEYSRLYIEAEDTLKSSIEVAYLIPEEYGYTASNKRISDEYISMKYTDGEKEFIFEQSVLKGTPYVNTEGYFAEQITINGNNGFFIQMGSEVYLSWAEDGYTFTIVGNIDKDEVVKLAEATKNKKWAKGLLT